MYMITMDIHMILENINTKLTKYLQKQMKHER